MNNTELDSIRKHLIAILYGLEHMPVNNEVLVFACQSTANALLTLAENVLLKIAESDVRQNGGSAYAH